MTALRSIAIVSSQAFSLVNFRGPLIAALVDAGVTVYAFAPDFDPPLRTRLAALGAIPIHFSLSRAGIDPFRDCRDLLALARALKLLKPDAVLTYFVKPVIYGSIAAWLARVPYRAAMIEGLGFVFMSDPSAKSLKRRALRLLVMGMYKCALRMNQRVFFLNTDDLHDFLESGLVQADRAVHIDGIGLDLEHFRYSKPPTQPMTFVLVARMLREKGVLDFVAAARSLRAAHPDARFVLVGDTDSNPGSVSSDELTRWSGEGSIVWAGHVPDVRVWLDQASVFVLPSYREGLPRSTQEAMATGRAVITTDVPGCRNTVIDGVNGLLVPVRDPQALAQAMERFVGDPAMVERMGLESRRLAELRFDVRRINGQILQSLGLGS